MILPEYVPSRWFEQLLHNQSALRQGCTLVPARHDRHERALSSASSGPSLRSTWPTTAAPRSDTRSKACGGFLVVPTVMMLVIVGLGIGLVYAEQGIPAVAAWSDRSPWLVPREAAVAHGVLGPRSRARS